MTAAATLPAPANVDDTCQDPECWCRQRYANPADMPIRVFRWRPGDPIYRASGGNRGWRAGGETPQCRS